MAGSCVIACPANSTANDEYLCECDDGYTTSGSTCVEIDECDPQPCLNGGTCTDLVNAFSCDCVAGFNGTTCDIQEGKLIDQHVITRGGSKQAQCKN